MTSQPSRSASVSTVLASPAAEAAADPTSGRIRLSGITARGYHGVFDSERVQGQDFVVDVVLEVDLNAAAGSDDLADTVDYGGLAAAVVADIEGKPLNLIEALAARIAETCVRFARVTSAEVTVHKPQAPMPVRVADVAVTLVRARPDGSGADHVRDGEIR